MKSVLLQGPPGSGKTTMMCRTAVRRPVHVCDVDRKLASMQNLQDILASGDLTFTEINCPIVTDDLVGRVMRLDKNLKPASQPQGWNMFARWAKSLDSDEVAQRAGTWGIDSITRLVEHLKQLILFHDERGISTFSERNYGTLLQFLGEVMTILIDAAKKYDKDLIIAVHERPNELPAVGGKVVKSRSPQGTVTREYLGPMDVKICASIEGQFGHRIGSYFEEVYGLSVVSKGASAMPEWTCRVLPDGIRDLRTSYKVTKPEFPCDFREIWK